LNSEASERHGDTQRELVRTKGSLQDNAALIEDLKRELASSTKQCEVLKEKLKEKESLFSLNDAKLQAGETKHLETISMLEGKVMKLETEQKLREAEIMQQTESMLREERTKVMKLSNENDALLVKLESQSETANSLEEYKKRAQVALKKVRFIYILHTHTNVNIL
jgi:myo-inositol-hexaphosphate 3-phosphohydrolase